MTKRILIINPFGIGDVIFSTPLIEALRNTYPDSHICYVCNKRAHEVIISNPNLNKVYIYEKDDYRTIWQRSKIECVKKILNFLKLIRKERFDIAIDLSLGYQYSLLLKLIGVRRRLGLNYRNRGKFLTEKIDIDGFNDKHVIEYYIDILGLLNINFGNYKISPRVYITEKGMRWADDFLEARGVNKEDLLIGIIPGCGASWGSDAKYRRWGRDGFAEVCDNVIERYRAKVILFGDAKEVEVCEGVQRMMKHKALMACGKTTLCDFLGLVNRCKLVITNDGGPLHMAVGIGANTISIFGPVDEKIYGPYPPSPNHIVISRSMACRPCYKKFKYTHCDKKLCLESIAADEVFQAVEGALRR